MIVTEIIFDIETEKLFSDLDNFDPQALGVSIVCLYKRKFDTTSRKEIEGENLYFWKNDLDTMWPVFANTDRVIGFNSIDFDNQVIFGLCDDYDFRKLKHFDILAKVKDVLGFRVSLDSIAVASLDKPKSDSGVMAVEYWKSQKPEDLEKLKKYCLMDVEITKDVYDFGLKNKFLKYKDKWNTIRQVEIDFDYEDSQNLSLFG